MVATKREDITYVNKDKKSPQLELTVIENKGVVVDNSKLPVGCRYCELKWEQR